MRLSLVCFYCLCFLFFLSITTMSFAGYFLVLSSVCFPCLLRGPTIGEGGDTTISSPARSPKQTLPGIELHDPLHDRQDCPEFIAFDQGIGQICPQRRDYFRAVPSQNGDKFVTSPPPPQLLNGSNLRTFFRFDLVWFRLSCDHRWIRRGSVNVR